MTDICCAKKYKLLVSTSNQCLTSAHIIAQSSNTFSSNQSPPLTMSSKLQTSKKPTPLKLRDAEDMLRQAMFDPRSPLLGGRSDGLEYRLEDKSSQAQTWRQVVDGELYRAGCHWFKEIRRADVQDVVLEAL